MFFDDPFDEIFTRKGSVWQYGIERDGFTRYWALTLVIYSTVKVAWKEQCNILTEVSFDLSSTSEFKTPLSWHCERACGREESSCKCFRGYAVKGEGGLLVTSWPTSSIWNDRESELESKWILMKHLVYPCLLVSYPDLPRPSGWECSFQVQLHGRISVRDYSFPSSSP